MEILVTLTDKLVPCPVKTDLGFGFYTIAHPAGLAPDGRTWDRVLELRTTEPCFGPMMGLTLPCTLTEWRALVKDAKGAMILGAVQDTVGGNASLRALNGWLRVHRQHVKDRALERAWGASRKIVPACPPDVSVEGRDLSAAIAMSGPVPDGYIRHAAIDCCDTTARPRCNVWIVPLKGYV